MAEFDSGAGISTGRPRFTYTCVQCGGRWDSNLAPHENPRCPRCAAVEIERHEAERRNRARKIREAKAAIRAAHAKLAELRGAPQGPRRWRMKVGDTVRHAVSGRGGVIAALHPGAEWAADVRFYDLPEHLVRLPTASLELIG